MYVSVHMCEVHECAHKRVKAGVQRQFHFLVIIHIEFWDTCLSLAWGSLKQLVLAVQQVAWTSVFLPLFWSTGCFVWCIKCRPSHLQGKCWSYLAVTIAWKPRFWSNFWSLSQSLHFLLQCEAFLLKSRPVSARRKSLNMAGRHLHWCQSKTYCLP